MLTAYQADCTELVTIGHHHHVGVFQLRVRKNFLFNFPLFITLTLLIVTNYSRSRWSDLPVTRTLTTRTGGVWNSLTHSLNYLLNVFNYFYEVSFPTSFAVLWFVYNGSFLGYGSSREEERERGRARERWVAFFWITPGGFGSTLVPVVTHLSPTAQNWSQQ